MIEEQEVVAQVTDILSEDVTKRGMVITVALSPEEEGMRVQARFRVKAVPRRLQLRLIKQGLEFGFWDIVKLFFIPSKTKSQNWEIGEESH